ncbi:MAG: hypothetical protein ACXACR_17775 [Candidatus Hodarchaeales archaeon]
MTEEKTEPEVTLDNLSIVAVDGIDKKFEDRLKKAGITTLTGLVATDAFEVYEKVKLPIHKFMEFQKKAELVLRLNFDEDIIDILAAKNYTIEQAIEEEPKSLKTLIGKDMSYVIEFLEKLVQVTIYFDAVTCRTRNIAILHRSKVFLELTKEQMLAKIYSNEVGRAVLELLQEKVRSRTELAELTENLLVKTKTTKTEFDDLLDLFVRTEIVQQEWIDYELNLFLIADFILYRRPAHAIVEAAGQNLPSPQLAENYLQEVQEFFSDYQPSNEDNLIVAENLEHPASLEILMLLRQNPYTINNFPETLEQKGKNIKELLKPLQEKGIVKILKDKQNEEWVLLVTDITAQVFYPEYILEKIRSNLSEKKLSPKLALTHLDLLEHNYDTFFKLL